MSTGSALGLVVVLKNFVSIDVLVSYPFFFFSGDPNFVSM